MHRYRRSGFVLVEMAMAMGLLVIGMSIFAGSIAVFRQNASMDLKAAGIEEAQGLMQRLQYNPQTPLPDGWQLTVLETVGTLRVVRLSYDDLVHLDGLVPLP